MLEALSPPNHVEKPARNRAARIVLLVALILAAVIQTIVVLRSPIVQHDGIVFLEIAQGMTTDPVTTMREADQHPGYPALIVLGKWCLGWAAADDEVGAWILGARVFPWLGGIVSVFLIWLIARRVGDERTASVAALAAVVLPLFRQNAADALSDTPCLVFYLLSTWLLLEGLLRRGVLWIAGAALTSAIGYLIRPEGLSVAVVAAGALLVLALRKDSRRFALKSVVAIALLGAAFATPYILVKGNLTGKKDVIAVVRDMVATLTGGENTETPGDPDQTPPLVNRIAGCAWEITDEYVEEGLRYVFIAPLLLGIFADRKRRTPPTVSWILGALAVFHLFLLIVLRFTHYYVGARHVFFWSALSMPYIGTGTFVLGTLVKRWLARIALAPAWLTEHRATVLIVLVTAIVFLPWNLRRLHKSRIPIAGVATWIRENTEPEDLLLTTSHHLLFYSNRQGKRLADPNDTLPELTAHPTPPYSLVVLEEKRCKPEYRWLPAIQLRYRKQKVPGVSGGRRAIKILRPRENAADPGGGGAAPR